MSTKIQCDRCFEDCDDRSITVEIANGEFVVKTQGMDDTTRGAREFDFCRRCFADLNRWLMTSPDRPA